MATFQCLIRPLAALVGRRSAVPTRTVRAFAADILNDLGELDVPGPQGPGWFDSSWELGHGLDVREGLPGDAGLYEWLDVCLRDDARVQRGPRVGSRATSRVTSRATSRNTASPTSITAIA